MGNESNALMRHLEAHMKCELPAEYKDHVMSLSAYEKPAKAYFNYDRNGRKQWDWVAMIYSLSTADGKFTLAGQQRLFAKVVPFGYMPIAGTAVDNILLCLTGNFFGQCVIRNWEDWQLAGGRRDDGIYRVASSFGELLAMLQDDPGDEEWN